MGDGSRVMREVLYWVLVCVVEGLARRIVAGSFGLSERSRKTSHTVYHSFLNSFSLRLSLWSTWKEKGSESKEYDRWFFWEGFWGW